MSEKLNGVETQPGSHSREAVVHERLGQAMQKYGHEVAQETIDALTQFGVEFDFSTGVDDDNETLSAMDFEWLLRTEKTPKEIALLDDVISSIAAGGDFEYAPSPSFMLGHAEGAIAQTQMMGEELMKLTELADVITELQQKPGYLDTSVESVMYPE